jgi:hypothetical protein
LIKHGDCSIIKATAIVEGEFLLPAGAGLQLFKQLVLDKKIVIDLSCPVRLNKELPA